jgi:Txe/YoeB family toxin of toxin-antitoxin system
VSLYKAAVKDIEKIKSLPAIYKKLRTFISVLEDNPYTSPPSYEKLGGDLKGLYSRRLNIKHRLVYEVIEKTKEVRILSCWTHYE